MRFADAGTLRRAARTRGGRAGIILLATGTLLALFAGVTLTAHFRGDVSISVPLLVAIACAPFAIGITGNYLWYRARIATMNVGAGGDREVRGGLGVIPRWADRFGTALMVLGGFTVVANGVGLAIALAGQAGSERNSMLGLGGLGVPLGLLCVFVGNYARQQYRAAASKSKGGT